MPGRNIGTNAQTVVKLMAGANRAMRAGAGHLRRAVSEAIAEYTPNLRAS